MKGGCRYLQAATQKPLLFASFLTKFFYFSRFFHFSDRNFFLKASVDWVAVADIIVFLWGWISQTSLAFSSNFHFKLYFTLWLKWALKLMYSTLHSARKAVYFLDLWWPFCLFTISCHVSELFKFGTYALLYFYIHPLPFLYFNFSWPSSPVHQNSRLKWNDSFGPPL